MTEKQCIVMCNGLLQSVLNSTIRKCVEYSKSGAVDLSSEDKDDFTIPKAMVYAALHDAGIAAIAPLSDKGKKARNNLLYF